MKKKRLHRDGTITLGEVFVSHTQRKTTLLNSRYPIPTTRKPQVQLDYERFVCLSTRPTSTHGRSRHPAATKLRESSYYITIAYYTGKKNKLYSTQLKIPKTLSYPNDKKHESPVRLHTPGANALSMSNLQAMKPNGVPLSLTSALSNKDHDLVVLRVTHIHLAIVAHSNSCRERKHFSAFLYSLSSCCLQSFPNCKQRPHLSPAPRSQGGCQTHTPATCPLLSRPNKEGKRVDRPRTTCPSSLHTASARTTR